MAEVLIKNGVVYDPLNGVKGDLIRSLLAIGMRGWAIHL